MQAGLAQAVEALTRSVEQLSRSVAARGPEWMTAYATIGLALVTVVLAIAAARSARHARKAAEAANASAEATKTAAKAASASATATQELAVIERERQRDADRPELMIRCNPQAGQGDAHREHVSVELVSIGKGWAETIDCTYAFALEGGDGQLQPLAPYSFPPEGRTLGPKGEGSNRVSTTAMFMVPRGRNRRDVIVCHYTDVFHAESDPRVYHSVVDNANPKCPRRHYRWDQPCAEYRSVCRGCQGGAQTDYLKQ